MTLQTDPEGNEGRHLRKFVDFTNTRVLEVGCGEGRLTWKYAAKPAFTVGFDLDVTALRIAQLDRPAGLTSKVDFVAASARSIPFADEQFDIAVLSWSL